MASRQARVEKVEAIRMPGKRGVQPVVLRVEKTLGSRLATTNRTVEQERRVVAARSRWPPSREKLQQ